MTVIYKNDGNTEIYIRITSRTIEVLTPEEAKASLNKKKYNDKKTIYEHYKYFIAIQNITTNSKKTLLVALNNLVGNNNLRKKVTEIDFSQKAKQLLQKNLKNHTKIFYLTNCRYFFSWLHENELIPYNPLQNFKIPKLANDISKRPALNCDNFHTLNDAKKEISLFFQNIHQNQPIYIYKIWLIQFIVATRIHETIQLIKNYKENDSYVAINTKCRKNFIIPITSILGSLIKDTQQYVNKYKDFAHSLRRTIPIQYKNLFTIHGCRAIYRTTIELLEDNKTFTFEEKEAYICHFNFSSTEKSYLRTDYFEKRKQIQKVWAEWLISITSNLTISNTNPL